MAFTVLTWLSLPIPIGMSNSRGIGFLNESKTGGYMITLVATSYLLENMKYIHKGINVGQEHTQQTGTTGAINLYGTILFFFHFPNLIFSIDYYPICSHKNLLKFFQ